MASPPPSAQLQLEVQRPDGSRSVHVFDAATDRRVIIGRAASCDLVVEDGGCSRKHAMLLCSGTGWTLQDLGSSNGVTLNGRNVQSGPVDPGDVLAIGRTRIRLLSASALPRELGRPTQLTVDLLTGRADFDAVTLPLSPAELVWFGYLSSHRARGAGWVVAGIDGHAGFRRFAAALLDRDWARGVKTRPLLALARGDDVDDEDLKNLRGKTAQKLKQFCTGEHGWMAEHLVPVVSGKNLQRLPLPSACHRMLGAPTS